MRWNRLEHVQATGVGDREQEGKPLQKGNENIVCVQRCRVQPIMRCAGRAGATLCSPQVLGAVGWGVATSPLPSDSSNSTIQSVPRTSVKEKSKVKVVDWT